MPPLTFDQAKQWLNNISSKDTVAIIHDGDTDGFGSGIIYYEWCKEKEAKTNHFAFKKGIMSIKDMKLENYNKIIFTDIAINVTHDELSLLRGKEVLYCDHHIYKNEGIPSNILIYNPFEKGYFPSSRIAYEFTNKKPLFALVGLIGDAADLYKENDLLIKELTDKFKIDIGYCRDEVSGVVNAYIVLSEKRNKLEEAFETLSKINNLKELEKIKEIAKPVLDEINQYLKEIQTKKETVGKIVFYQLEPYYNIKGTISTIISMRDKHPMIFISSLDKEFYSISTRDNSRTINMRDLLVKCIEGLKNSGGGGHAFAAGAKIRKEDLPKFKENVKNYLNSLK